MGDSMNNSMNDAALESLKWIVEYILEHPEWDDLYFREGGECHAESDWFDQAAAIVGKGTYG